MSRHALSRFALLAVALLLLPLSAAAEDTLRLGHNRSWSNPGLLIGLGTGQFEKAGVRVAETEFTNPADIITAIASGSLDAGASPGPTLVASVVKGVKVKAVAVLQGNNRPPISYTVLSDSGISKVSDLRGKKAGVNNYGGAYDVYLRYWLAKHGVDPKTDAEIVVVPVPAMLPALINRQIDVVPLAAFDQSLAQQRYPGKTAVLFTYDEVIADGVGTTNNNSIVLAMSDAYIATQRAAAVRFLQGYLRAVRALNADPKQGLEDWARTVGNPALRNLTSPPIVPQDGKVYLDALQFDADLALRFGYIQAPLDVRTIVDHSLIEAAAASL